VGERQTCRAPRVTVHGVLSRNKALVEERSGRLESRTEWHRCLAFGKLAEFAASLKKGAHVQIEGELRSGEYEKSGVAQRVFECHIESILKLDRAARQDTQDAGEEVGD
jgi:single-strand DNA-binding protein